MKSLVFALLSLVFATAAVAQGTYIIRIGDQLDISVLEDPNLNRSVLVRPDGQITVPLAGTISAAGRTPEAVQAALTARLASGFSVTPTVTVSVAALGRPVATGSRKIEVFVIGEVGSPGSVKVKSGSTVLQVLSQSGGIGQFAADKRIQVHSTDPRTGKTSMRLFNYAGIESGKNISSITMRVKDGDVIVVPERNLFE